VNFDDKISAWKDWADPEKANDVNANRAITDINATLPQLTAGTQKARAYLYLGQAYLIVDRQTAACDAFLKGRAESNGAERSIEALITAVGCK
jgi:hypothetical protein